MSLIQNLVSGLNVSAMLMVAALGLVIVFGLMKVINMAHGELMMLGAYMTYFVTGPMNGNFFIAILISFAVTGTIGVLIEGFVIKKLYSKPTETLLATYAISLILERVARLVFGPDTKNVPMPIPGNTEIGTVTIPYYNIFVITFACALLAFTIFIFQKTQFGRKVKAITQNRAMVECLGIETDRVDTQAFGYGAGLAGIAGALLAPVISVTPSMGAPYLTESFMTVVVGGVESVIGAAAGALITGEIRTVLGGLTNAVTAKILVFVIIILVIRFRPNGLFSVNRR